MTGVLIGTGDSGVFFRLIRVRFLIGYPWRKQYWAQYLVTSEKHIAIILFDLRPGTLHGPSPYDVVVIVGRKFVSRRLELRVSLVKQSKRTLSMYLNLSKTFCSAQSTKGVFQRLEIALGLRMK